MMTATKMPSGSESHLKNGESTNKTVDVLPFHGSCYCPCTVGKIICRSK